jgi:hypothetical protein
MCYIPEYDREYVDESSELEYIFLSNLDKPWKYASLSRNPRTTPRMIRACPDAPWDWGALSRLPLVAGDGPFVEEYESMPWIWSKVSLHIDMATFLSRPDLPLSVSSNHRVTISAIRSRPHGDWDWSSLSCNYGISMSDILANLDLPWSWMYVSMNPNVDMASVEGHLALLWDWYCMDRSIHITDRDILRHASEDWDWGALSRRSTATFWLVSRLSDKRWDWAALSARLDISDIARTADRYPWKWRSVSGNPGITLELVRRLGDRGWDWKRLGQRIAVSASYFTDRSLPPEFIEALQGNVSMTGSIAHELWHLPDTEFDRSTLDWRLLSANYGTTCYDVDEFPELPWDFKGISRNPNLTAWFVSAHSTADWDWSHISRNDFTVNVGLRPLAYHNTRGPSTVAQTAIFEEELMARVWRPGGAMFHYYCEDIDI